MIPEVRACQEEARLYFVIVNVSVFEIERMPDGAAGSNVTNAE